MANKKGGYYYGQSSARRGIAIFIAVILVLGAAATVFCWGARDSEGNWAANPTITEWFDYWGAGAPSDKEPDKNPDESKDPEGDNKPSGELALASYTIAAADFEAYNVSPRAEEAYALTVSRIPSHSLITGFEWSVEFVNPSAAWAKGKEVTEYVDIKPAADKLSAVAECYQPFGEQIKAVVKYAEDETITASCTFGYQKKLDKVTARWDDDPVFGSSVRFEPSVAVSWTVGTTSYGTSAEVVSAWYELSDDAWSYITEQETLANTCYQAWLQNGEGKNWTFSKTSRETAYKENPTQWMNSCKITSFTQLEGDETMDAEGDNFGYIAAAIKDMAQHVTNHYRLCVKYALKNTNGEILQEGTAYSDWLSIDAGSITSTALTLNGVTIPEGSHIFGQN